MKLNRFSLVLLTSMAIMLALSTVTKAQTIDVCYNGKEGSLRILLSGECRNNELTLSLYTKEGTEGLVSDLQAQINILAKHILALESGGPKSATLTMHQGPPMTSHLFWFDLETANVWNPDEDDPPIPSQYDIAFNSYLNGPEIQISNNSQKAVLLPNTPFDSVHSAYGLGFTMGGNILITNADTIVIHTNEGKYFKIGDVVYDTVNMTATFRYAQIFPLE